MRVAGAIWSPLIPQRRSLFRPTMYMGDWLPTLAAAANIPLNQTALHLDGLNLWPALGDPTNNVNYENIDREIVHYLDDVWPVAALQQGEWKYVNGTTAAGRYNNVLTYRELYDTDPRSVDYFAAVKNSSTSQILQKYDKNELQRGQVNKLRNEATIDCGNGVQRSCNPLWEECLYNVAVDPCERNNLASLNEYKKILRRMRRSVRQHRSTSIPMANRRGSFEHSPSRHRCLWSNFLEDAPSEGKLRPFKDNLFHVSQKKNTNSSFRIFRLRSLRNALRNCYFSRGNKGGAYLRKETCFVKKPLIK